MAVLGVGAVELLAPSARVQVPRAYRRDAQTNNIPLAFSLFVFCVRAHAGPSSIIVRDTSVNESRGMLPVAV